MGCAAEQPSTAAGREDSGIAIPMTVGLQAQTAPLYVILLSETLPPAPPRPYSRSTPQVFFRYDAVSYLSKRPFRPADTKRSASQIMGVLEIESHNHLQPYVCLICCTSWFSLLAALCSLEPRKYYSFSLYCLPQTVTGAQPTFMNTEALCVGGLNSKSGLMPVLFVTSPPSQRAEKAH